VGAIGKILVTALIVVVAFVVFNYIFTLTRDETPSDKAMTNSFINGCVGSGVSSLVCKCFLDELNHYHNGRFLTMENIQRVNRDGYSRLETEAVMSCMDQV
jgi:hypothetical protein